MLASVIDVQFFGWLGVKKIEKKNQSPSPPKIRHMR